jgi:hypothetical protein
METMNEVICLNISQKLFVSLQLFVLVLDLLLEGADHGQVVEGNVVVVVLDLGECFLVLFSANNDRFVNRGNLLK